MPRKGVGCHNIKTVDGPDDVVDATVATCDVESGGANITAVDIDVDGADVDAMIAAGDVESGGAAAAPADTKAPAPVSGDGVDSAAVAGRCWGRSRATAAGRWR